MQARPDPDAAYCFSSRGLRHAPLPLGMRPRENPSRRPKAPARHEKERRVQQVIKLIIQGFVRRRLRLVEGIGKAFAEEVSEQMTDKHPQLEES